MSNKVKRELEKVYIPEELHNRARLGVAKAKEEMEGNNRMGEQPTKHKKKQSFASPLYKRLLVVAAVFLIVVSTLTFTPALAAIQEAYDKIFSTKHIDDAGVRVAVHSGNGQTLDQSFYDKKHDITVHFDRVLTDEKETKLLLTYHSEETDLENYYIDLFEGVSTINLIVGNEKMKLDNVGWGSRYYNSKENKVAEALSFESIKEYAGQQIRLEIENLTIWNDGKGSVETTWPLEFKLKQSALSNREKVEVNEEFTFKGETYRIKRVEFSAMETRVVVTGSDIKPWEENGRKLRTRSKLEKQFMNPREVSKEYGYRADVEKPGVYLRSADEKVVPIYSKGEVQDTYGQYVMIFAPVKDRQDCVLQVGEDIKISLTE